jgi:hypothetical protein
MDIRKPEYQAWLAELMAAKEERERKQSSPLRGEEDASSQI